RHGGCRPDRENGPSQRLSTLPAPAGIDGCPDAAKRRFLRRNRPEAFEGFGAEFSKTPTFSQRPTTPTWTWPETVSPGWLADCPGATGAPSAPQAARARKERRRNGRMENLRAGCR